MGELVALLCALSWSIALILLKDSQRLLSPIALNWLKNVLGTFLMIPTVCFWYKLEFPHISSANMGILVLSGTVGIGVADGLVLMALKSLSASHIAILECLFTPFVMALSYFYLGEILTALQLTGGVCILLAIYIINKGGPREASFGRQMLRPTLLMVSGLLFMALGIVITKPVFLDVPLGWVLLIRMATGAVASSVLLLPAKEKVADIWQRVRHARGKSRLFWACVMSSYVSIILWMAGYKYNQATIAAVLNQTSTIFTVLLAVAFLGESLNKSKVMAAFLATLGVIIMTLA